MVRQLSRSTAVQLRVSMAYCTLTKWEPDWERGWSADAAGSRPASWQWLAVATPTVPLPAPNFPPPYRSQRVLQLRLSCQVAGGGGVRSPDLTFFAGTRPPGCPCRDRSPTRHVPFHWDSLVDLLQHFNYSANLPLLWNSFLSVKSRNKGHKLGFGVLFHLLWPSGFDFGVFLPFLIFSFHIAFARTPPKIKSKIHSQNLVFVLVFP